MNKRVKRSFCAGMLVVVLMLSCVFTSVCTTQAAQTGTGDYYIKVNKGTNVVTVYEKDGTPYTAFTCSVGYATPIGTFYTPAKYRWWTLQGPCYGQYCTRITRGFLFHSVWYYSQSMSTQSYKQYNKLGTTASHGCVRLTVAASKWIYDNCPLGTKVIIFNGTSKDDPLGKPETIKVDESKYMGWDPTDPASGNPFKSGSAKPKITVSSKTLTYGKKFAGGNMTCKDSGGFTITDWVKQSGTVNTKKVGSYKVIYSVLDSFGRTATKEVTYKVVDKKAAKLTGVKAAVSKNVGDTYKPLKGVKAKDSVGVNLTKKIALYVKYPGADEFKKCTTSAITLEQAGVYRLKYVITNPNNGKKTTKTQRLTVTDKEAPVLNCENDWAQISAVTGQTLTWNELVEGMTAVLPGGEDLTANIEVKILAPSGSEATITSEGNYVFNEAGEYKLTYSVTNPNAKVSKGTVTKERTLVVGTEQVSAEQVEQASAEQVSAEQVSAEQVSAEQVSAEQI